MATSQRFTTPFVQFTTVTGLPRAGGSLGFYLTNTDTPAPTYANPDLTSPNPNPVPLNELGQPDTAIWLDATIQYKVRLFDADGGDVWTADPNLTLQITAAFSAFAGNPNGQLAGTAGTPGVNPADVVWDVQSDTLWVCTTTGSATTAVWTAVGATIGGALVLSGTLTPPTPSGTINDYNPAGLSGASTLRFNLGGDVILTGLEGGVDGRDLTIENVTPLTTTPASLVLPVENVSSLAKNRFTMPFRISLPPGQSMHLRYDGASSRWRPAQRMTAGPSLALPQGLVIKNGGTPNTQLSVSFNSPISLWATALSHATIGETGYNLNSFTINALTVGANGLDTGALAANTWYAVWVIMSSSVTSGSLAALLSLSATAPTLPAGYEHMVRVGWVRTDGSGNFLRTLQLGAFTRYQVTAGTNTTQLPIAASGVAGTYNTQSPTLINVSLASLIPSTAVMVSLNATGRRKFLSTSQVLIAPSTAWGGTQNGPGGSNGVVWPMSTDAGVEVTAQINLMLETPQQIAWASSAAGGAMAVYGWRDNF